MTTQARELAKLVNNSGDVNLVDDITLGSDGALLNFGADSDVVITHVADTGLLLNSSRQLQFGDSGTHIRQSADGVLQLTSDTEVEINATTIDINGNVDISGNLVLGGNITIGDADSDDISFGGELTSHIIPNADDTFDLGSSTKQWRNVYVDGTLEADAITVDGVSLAVVTSENVSDIVGAMFSSNTETNITVTYQDSDNTIDLVVDAAQPNVTSLGTLTALDVDNINLNGNTIKSTDSDGDLIFKGNDGGSEITALTLDMSQLGEADFTGSVKVGGSIVAHQTNRGVFEYASNIFKIRSYGATSGTGQIAFQTAGGGNSADSEAMRITNNGDVGIGTSNPNNYSGYTTLTLNHATTGGIIDFEVNGTLHGEIYSNNTGIGIQTAQADDSIFFKGNDGGATITALTLDMADAGTATFNHDVKLIDSSEIKLGTGGDMRLFHDATNNFIICGNGAFSMKANGINIMDNQSHNMATFAQDGAVTLMYDNATKLATESGGVNVTGYMDADNFKINGAQGSDGQLMTSTGSGVAWEDAPASGPSKGLAIAFSMIF